LYNHSLKNRKDRPSQKLVLNQQRWSYIYIYICLKVRVGINTQGWLTVPMVIYLTHISARIIQVTNVSLRCMTASVSSYWASWGWYGYAQRLWKHRLQLHYIRLLWNPTVVKPRPATRSVCLYVELYMYVNYNENKKRMTVKRNNEGITGRPPYWAGGCRRNL